MLNAKKSKQLILVVGIIGIAGALVWYLSNSQPPATALDSFAQCLRDKRVMMYGADWCPHCQNEKKAFGESFRFVNYIECPKEPQKCLSANINGYPTWTFTDGRRFEGELGLQKLSLESGCALASEATAASLPPQ